MIIVLLTESYDEYWNDYTRNKGIHSSIKKVAKKVKIDRFLISAKFLRRERPKDTILQHFTKILDDLMFLTGNQDEVSFLLTSGLPFNQDFLQLYYSGVIDKTIEIGSIFEIKNTDVENMGNKAEIIEISLEEGNINEAKESLLNTYSDFLKMILGD